MTHPLIHLALVSLLLSWGHAYPVQARRWHVEKWAVEVDDNRFSGAKACRIARGSISYRRQALVFRLAANVDTRNAVYRVDAGSPRLAGSDLPDLAKLGFAIYADDLDNASGGLVRIPETRLRGARLVWIAPSAKAQPIRFMLDGFSAAREAARAAGCSEPDFD